MKRRLTLSSERLTDLTEAELRLAAGAAADEDSITMQVDCMLSIRHCFTNQFCSVWCFQTG